MLPTKALNQDNDSSLTGNDEYIELPMSARAMVVLSRAAKRNVQKQQQLIMQSNPNYRRYLKSSYESRKRNKKPEVYGVTRTEVYSAPPNLGQNLNGESLIPFKDPPRIVVISASQDGGQCDVEEIETQQGDVCARKDLPANSADKLEEETPRSTMSYLTSINDMNSNESITPDIFKQYEETPRSTVSFTDWAWVRERLSSRESAFTRPESSLTFTDFLESLDPDSDEYDTDLEENFVDFDFGDSDRTGVWHYRRICKRRGIAPAHQVVQKLSDENMNFQLNHRCLSSKDTMALAGGLSHNTFVQNLDLSGNCIDDEGAHHLVRMLKKNHSICRLNLSDNCLRNDAGNHISDMLRQNTTLTHICVSHNKLADKEALMMSEVLRCNNALQSLDVSHNQFTDLAGQSFAAALMDNNSLTSLNLAWNMLGKLAAAAIGKALKVNECLLSLDMSYNGLGDDGAALLGRPLRSNTTLRHLSLAVNHIGPFGAERLASGICGSRNKRGKKSSCVLRSLILDRNPLGRKGVTAFIKYLEVSEHLIDLSIREVVLTSEIVCLIRQLMSSRTVSVFYEGQREEDKLSSAMQYGAIYLRQILSQNKIQVSAFFDCLDPKRNGLKLKELKGALSNLNQPASELALDRLLQSLNAKRTGKIHYKDIIKYSYTPPQSKPLKPTRARKKYSISKF